VIKFFRDFFYYCIPYLDITVPYPSFFHYPHKQITETARFKYFVSILFLMSEDKEFEGMEEEEELELPQANNKTETEKYLEDLINQVESQLPPGINYISGIIVDDDRNVLIIKDSKLYVGKDLQDAVEIRKYVENANPAYVINGLYILKEMIPSYRDFWSGELERKARKTMWDIL